jgi:hypothetical protein
MSLCTQSAFRSHEAEKADSLSGRPCQSRTRTGNAITMKRSPPTPAVVPRPPAGRGVVRRGTPLGASCLSLGSGIETRSRRNGMHRRRTLIPRYLYLQLAAHARNTDEPWHGDLPWVACESSIDMPGAVSDGSVTGVGREQDGTSRYLKAREALRNHP